MPRRGVSTRVGRARANRCCSVLLGHAFGCGRHHTTHYIPRELADSLATHQVSLYVNWEGESERELQMDGFDGFYERLRTDPVLPSTSQPSIGDFLAVWEPLIEAGQDIVSVHLSGGISGT